MAYIDNLLYEIKNTPVPFLQLREIISFKNGKGHEQSIVDNGLFIVVNSKFISSDGVSFKCSNEQICPVYKNDILMVMSDLPSGKALAKCFIVDEDGKYTLNQRIGCFSNSIPEKINNKYLFYVLNRNQQLLRYDNGVDQTNLRKDDILDIKIPVPSLAIQERIVHVLDCFADLSLELSSELSARKKQYDYYRDLLLTFDETIPCYPLGELATIVRGASPRPISRFITSGEGVNWIKIGDVEPGAKYITSTEEKITFEGAKHSRFVKKGDFILSNSMSFGRPYILAIDGCIHDGWLSISNFEKHFIPDYLYHLLNCTKIQHDLSQKASFGGAVQNLNADIVRGIVLPVPSISIQKDLVVLLDKFDALTSDCTQGIPAEIEARKKQFEYYKDQLLSFKEL